MHSRHGDCTADSHHELGLAVPRFVRSLDTAFPAVLLFVCIPALSSAAAQTESAPQKTFFEARDAALGAALLAASAGVSLFDVRIARFFQDTSLAHVRAGRRVDDAFTHINETTLTVGSFAVYAIAQLTKHRTVADVAFHATESVAAASIASQVIRGPVGRTRPLDTTPPYGDQYDFNFFKGFNHFKQRAFPSIHSASGFAAATAIVAEVQRRNRGATWFVAVPTYAIAMSPGLSRMYLGQHWASDIVSGAFLGTFFGSRVASYSHSHPTTRIDRMFLGSVERASIAAHARGASFNWTIAF